MELSPVIDVNKLRQVAGAFATGITVVTTEDAEGQIQGMTANSFLSVSLNPPLVLFSVDENSAILEHLAIDKAVGISILCDNQLNISNQFAGFNEEDIEVDFLKKGTAHIIDDCLAWYSTKIQQIIPAGDHSLILCEVLDLDRVGERDPILFYAGYRQVGNSI